eukprot:m.185504 g.185504  ORF g.185504 m.185504 type:complete len:175 (-) comp15575_c0_seq9:572-1096(-)
MLAKLAPEGFICEQLKRDLVTWAVELQTQNKTGLVKRVSRQASIIQCILDTNSGDREDAIQAFFERLQSDTEFQTLLEEQHKAMQDYIGMEALMREDSTSLNRDDEEEKARLARLGPGGLDPMSVLRSMSPSMKEAFETENIPLLKQSFMSLPKAVRALVNSCLNDECEMVTGS